MPHLYQFNHIITGDIVDLPLPNIGLYHIVVGCDPEYGARVKHDNFHWQLATKPGKSNLSRRALKITIEPNGFFRLTAIGRNTIYYRFTTSQNYIPIKPENSSAWLDPRKCVNLTFKIGDNSSFKVISARSNNDQPFSIHSLLRII